MAYNFNDDRIGPGGGQVSREAMSAAAPTEARTTAEAPQSPAHTRFNSCRWQQPAEDGNAAFCTHREVKPYAGTTGFDAQAWCLDCQYYKLRRTPKKRQPEDEYTY